VKILITSDVHVHSWPAFSTLDSRGFNSRLLDTLRVIDDLGDVAEREKADVIVIAGDLTHVTKIDVHVFALLAGTLRQLHRRHPKIPKLIIEGNHDRAAQMRGLSSIAALRECGLTILSDFGCLPVLGMSFFGRAYGETNLPAEPADVAVIHQGVRGSEISEYFTSAFENDLDPSEAHRLAKHLVIAGHYHNRQVIDPVTLPLNPTILIPGAPIQHVWSDAGQQRGFTLADVTPSGLKSLKFIPLTGYPKFIRVTEKNFESAMNDIDGNFVQVTFDSDLPHDILAPLTDELKKRARAFSIQAGAPPITRPEGDRLCCDPSVDPKTIVKEYAVRYGKDRATSLAALGLEFIQQAEERR